MSARRPRVLVVGGGGREHAIVRALGRSAARPEIVAAPGNPGMAGLAELVNVSATDVDGQVAVAVEREIDLVVVGPEAPLVLGLSDLLRSRGIAVLGPGKDAARLEGSKAFAKQMMTKAGVPTARWGSFDDARAALEFARSFSGRVAIKADGLAAGKGVIVADDMRSAEEAIRAVRSSALEASRTIVVEEKLEGPELSVIALTDGTASVLLPPAQDHKRVGEGDTGPNTGGMGAYAPAPDGTAELMEEVRRAAIEPILACIAAEGAVYRGFLYVGLILTREGPKVLEYNVRLGDPEAEAILPLMGDDVYERFMSAAKGRLDPTGIELAAGAALTVVLAAEGYPADPRVGDAIGGLDSAASLPGVIVFHSGTRTKEDRVVTASGRVLAVTGLGASLAEAGEVAYGAVARIHWPGMHYRRDIGWRVHGKGNA